MTDARHFRVHEAPLCGTNLIEASAGTGKTYAIATLFLRLLLEASYEVDRILVVTFTEAAAAELRDRIRTRLRQAIVAYDDPGDAEDDLGKLVRRRLQAGLHDRDRARLVASLHAFDEAAISTIHGFCHRVLHDRAFESGVAFDTELVVDDTAMLDDVVRDFWASQMHAADARFVRYLQRKHVTPGRLLDLARLATRHAFAPVRPDSIATGGSPQADAYADAYATARALWLSHRGEVVDMLSTFSHFKVGYDRTAVPRWALAIDAFLREPEAGTALSCTGFDRFLPATILDATRKHARSQVPQHAFLDAWARLAAAADEWSNHLLAREIDLRRRLITHVRTELFRRKAETGVQSFDDLLVRLRQALTARGGRRLAASIRERYPAALIDEFQDTDPTQYRIFEAIYRGSNAPCFFIGDPKQAIYGFRGADVFAYLQAASTCDARYTMATNWRSDPALLDAVARLFAVPDPFLLRGIGFVPVAPRPDATTGLWHDGAPLPAFEARFCRRDPELAKKKPPGPIPAEVVDVTLPDRIAADIANLLAQGVRVGGPDGRALHAGDVAVLVRKNDQALRMQRALRGVGIAAVVYGDVTVFETPEAIELQRVLQAVAEPMRAGRLRAAVTSELLGVSAADLHRMLATDDDPEWDDWVEHFRGWHGTWVERGFVQMFRALVEHPGVQRRVLGLVDGERRMTNLLHLGELLHETSRREHLGPEGLLRWLAEQIRHPPRTADADKLRLERDDKAVQLVTVHRAKGLEYPVVYCPYLWDGTLLFRREEDDLVFHDPDAGHELVLDIRPKGDAEARKTDPALRQARHERRAENLRLLYVALTRARHRCVIVWGGFRGSENSPLGYLLHATDPTDTPDAVAKRLRHADDDALFRQLSMRGEGKWTIRDFDEPSPPSPARAIDREAATLAGRRVVRPIERVLTVSSFSALAAGGSRIVAADEGRDRDQGSQREPIEPTPKAAPAVRLAAFPRGARAGNFFHDVLEHVDFAATPGERATLVDDRLRAHGFSTEQWSTTVADATAEILATPIEGGMRLADVARTHRRAELEFMLPVAHGSDTALSFTRERLARAFADHARGLPSGYAARIEALGFAPLRGHLKGFIDLVFAHEGRWWVVDYKTNHLGDTADDYAPPRLLAAMAEHHYVLQYHLYVVALVRHLNRTVPGFDYARDFGGAAYLFLRGMSPRTGSARGVFVDRPPVERIAALSQLLEGGR